MGASSSSSPHKDKFQSKDYTKKTYSINKIAVSNGL